ncbi:biotin/lipoate A/B protein ligase family protein, partial [Planctomycetota bacterium]
TGGGAIYHYKELTYSIVSQPGMLPIPAHVADTYRFLHAPFIRVLNELGIAAGDNFQAESKKVPVCFDSITPFDIVVGERKILGSAQRRHKQFFLQHGSLPLEPNPLSQRATSVGEELGRTVKPDELIPFFVDAISAQLGIEFEEDDLTEEEKKIATETQRTQRVVR